MTDAWIYLMVVRRSREAPVLSRVNGQRDVRSGAKAEEAAAAD